MSHSTSDLTKALCSDAERTPWWRSFFVNHPGRAHKAPEAFSGTSTKGKAKVFCGRCLDAKIEEAQFAEQSAAIVVFYNGAEDRGSRGQEAIANEGALQAWWH